MDNFLEKKKKVRGLLPEPEFAKFWRSHPLGGRMYSIARAMQAITRTLIRDR
jgi:hypothetical protein